MSDPIDSPCINICKLDPVTGLCLGCKRTLDEIAHWTAYTEAERRRVLEHVVRRELSDAKARTFI